MAQEIDHGLKEEIREWINDYYLGEAIYSFNSLLKKLILKVLIPSLIFVNLLIIVIRIIPKDYPILNILIPILIVGAPISLIVLFVVFTKQVFKAQRFEFRLLEQAKKRTDRVMRQIGDLGFKELQQIKILMNLERNDHRQELRKELEEILNSSLELRKWTFFKDLCLDLLK